MFEIHDVHVAYGAVTALRGISLEVHEREIVCLLGANGAGKSTTLRTVSGLLHPLRGEILLQGHPIHRLSAEAIATSSQQFSRSSRICRESHQTAG